MNTTLTYTFTATDVGTFTHTVCNTFADALAIAKNNADNGICTIVSVETDRRTYIDDVEVFAILNARNIFVDTDKKMVLRYAGTIYTHNHEIKRLYHN